MLRQEGGGRVRPSRLAVDLNSPKLGEGVVGWLIEERDGWSQFVSRDTSSLPSAFQEMSWDRRGSRSVCDPGTNNLGWNVF